MSECAIVSGSVPEHDGVCRIVLEYAGVCCSVLEQSTAFFSTYLHSITFYHTLTNSFTSLFTLPHSYTPLHIPHNSATPYHPSPHSIASLFTIYTLSSSSPPFHTPFQCTHGLLNKPMCYFWCSCLFMTVQCSKSSFLFR